MLYPIPYEYHDLIVDRRGGGPGRDRDDRVRRLAREGARRR